MKNKADIRVPTGVRNLDELLQGGVPKGAVIAIAGPPGAGKTILAQQICFHNVALERPALYFNTLSEPTAKILRYLSRFTFFDAKKIDGGLEFVDLGIILRTKGLEEASELVMQHVKRVKPTIVVIDSFRVFDDLAQSREELRKFGYEIAINLMAWESTTFLLGEYGQRDTETNPLFSIIDGIIAVSHRQESGEQQRFVQIAKMRGTNHNRDEHAFVITDHGIEVFAPRATIQRERVPPAEPRCQTGIERLDDLLGDGIPRGSSLLIAGVAGTGKTVLLLEFIYRGALMGEKGVLFSFEETPERLLAAARGLGWDLDREIERKMIEIVFIPQPAIAVEEHLLMMRERVDAMQAQRVGVDSVSVFLHKVKDAQIDREKIFQLASIVQNVQAVGFFATDIPYGSSQISRFGVEETVVDGVILLSATEEGLERQRYVEIYKLRNTAHLKGRHNMAIGPGGIRIFPRYTLEERTGAAPPAIETSRRLGSGVPGLDELLGGGLLERSVTLVSGSAGIGKSTLGLQFILEGFARKEEGLFVALEEGPEQLLASAQALGLPLRAAVEQGAIEIIYLSPEHVRAHQFLAILADRIRAGRTRRLVLDSASNMVMESLPADDTRQLLYGLATRFKMLGVTSLLTIESGSLYSTDTLTEHGFSAISDNLIMLRYELTPAGHRSTLRVVKTRGSGHAWGSYYFHIEQGGLRIEQLAAAPGDGGDKLEAPL